MPRRSWGWRLAWLGVALAGVGHLTSIDIGLGTVSAAQGTSTAAPAAPAMPPAPVPLPTKALPTRTDPYHLKLPTTSERLQALQRQLQAARQLSSEQKQRLESLQAALAALGSEQQSALAELEDLSRQMTTQQSRANALSVQVQDAQQNLSVTQSQVQLTAAQVARLQAEVRQVLLALYRQHNQQYLELLSQSQTLSDALIHAHYANIGGQHNVAMIEQLRAQRQQLSTQEQAQQRLATALSSLRAQHLEQLTRLRATQSRQQALLASLQRSQAGKRALALETQAQQELSAQNINQLIGKLIQERNAIEQRRRARIEAERVRRAEELRRIQAAQERARKEAARLAALRRAQAIARAKAVAQAKAAKAQQQAQLQAKLHQQALQAHQRAQALAQRQAELQRHQSSLQAQQHASALALAPLPAAPLSALAFPVVGGQVTQAFSAASPWTVIQGSQGAQAHAALGGNVLALNSYASLGWVVLIDHGSLVTAYLGLSDSAVHVGQQVPKGAALGHIGGSPVFGEGHMAFQLNRVSQNSRTPIAPPF